MSQERVALFYPGTELGGAEMLLARMALALADRGQAVTVIDGPAGVISQLISSLSAQGSASGALEIRCLAADGQTPVTVEIDLLISFASHLRQIDRWVRCGAETRLLFWCVHPYNAIYLPPLIGTRLAHRGLSWVQGVNRLLFRGEESASQRAVAFLAKHTGLACMDGENLDTLARYFPHANGSSLPLLPIPVALPLQIQKSIRQVTANVPPHLFWYGRLCDFKTHGLIRLMSDLSLMRSQDRPSPRLTIIGDGPDRSLVTQHAEALGLPIQLLGSLPNAEARALLGQEADIVFAMGTAALETAGQGLPTVLMPPSYGPLPADYRYQWLHDTTRFTLGSFQHGQAQANGWTLAQVMAQLETTAPALAERCLNYVTRHHALSAVADQLILLARQSGSRWDAYLQAVRYQPSLSLRLGRTLARRLRDLQNFLRTP